MRTPLEPAQPTVEEAVKDTFYILHLTSGDPPSDTKTALKQWQSLIDAAKFIVRLFSLRGFYLYLILIRTRPIG